MLFHRIQSSEFCNFLIRREIYVSSVLPQITPFSFGDEQDVNFDEAVAATCIITKGDTPIQVWWTLVDDFNGLERNLSTNDGILITRTSQKLSLLNIDAVKARHRGNYTCYAKNKAGISQHSAFLYINGDCFELLQTRLQIILQFVLPLTIDRSHLKFSLKSIHSPSATMR